MVAEGGLKHLKGSIAHKRGGQDRGRASIEQASLPLQCRNLRCPPWKLLPSRAAWDSVLASALVWLKQVADNDLR